MSKLRTTAPTTSNKYFIHTSKGGLNECILIKGKSVLPNCVGYCWGAWYEMLCERPKLSRRNAEEWYGYTSDGYKRGLEPKLGAVACYEDNTGKAHTSKTNGGHVAIVIGVNGDNVTVAQSNYGGVRWEIKTYKNGYISKDLKLQGYIYYPEETNEGGDEEVTTETAIKKMAEDVIAGKYGNGRYNRMNRLYNTIQAEVNKLMLQKK